MLLTVIPVVWRPCETAVCAQNSLSHHAQQPHVLMQAQIAVHAPLSFARHAIAFTFGQQNEALKQLYMARAAAVPLTTQAFLSEGPLA